MKCVQVMGLCIVRTYQSFIMAFLCQRQTVKSFLVRAKLTAVDFTVMQRLLCSTESHHSCKWEQVKAVWIRSVASTYFLLLVIPNNENLDNLFSLSS